jgi:hypothetical protein
MGSFTIMDGERSVQLDATVDADGVRIAPDSLHTELDWKLAPQGLCRGAVCVPVADRAGLCDERGIDLERFAQAIGRPVALEPDAACAALGTAAGERADRLRSLEAPDFTLPDLHGRPHSLHEYRGSKVLLIAYASW